MYIRDMNWKPMKITKSGHKKVRLLNEKSNKIKTGEEILKLHVLVNEAAEKFMNQISNFQKLQCEKSLSRNQ